MKPGKPTTPQQYRKSAIIYGVLVLLHIYPFITAYQQDKKFSIFVCGLALFLWMLFTVDSIVCYRRSIRSGINS